MFKEKLSGVGRSSELDSRYFWFIFDINDIVTVNNLAKLYLFADDTVFILKERDSLQLQNKTDGIMTTLSSWFQINRLSVSVSKT